MQRILLVEDDSQIASGLSEYLAGEGFRWIAPRDKDRPSRKWNKEPSIWFS